MRHRIRWIVVALLVVVCSCSGGGGGGGGIVAPVPEPSALDLAPVASGLSSPVLVTAPPGDPRVFIVEKTGTIRIVKNGTLLPTPFLDISSAVSTGYEEGLLGLAFDPRYATNGRFYVWITSTTGQEQLRRYQVGTDPDVANPAGTPILTFDDPHPNHNGGMIEFGPDGMLYASVGDGGESGDPNGRAQDPSDIFGSILRLDVRTGSVVIPADNPYAAPNRREVWSIGLRNPWRFSIDRGTGDLYVGDVGEDTREEISVARASTARGRGFNYGWNVVEGTECYNPGTGCNPAGKVAPVVEYPHQNGTCSVIGGYVYRGAAMPGLRGRYFYSDYCAGWVRSFRHGVGGATDEREWAELNPGSNVLSMGQDAAGELYLCTAAGDVWRIVDASTPVASMRR